MPVLLKSASLGWRSLKARITLLTLVIFLCSIWALTFISVNLLREDMQELVGQQQFSAATLVAAQADLEFARRLNALEALATQLAPMAGADVAALQKELEHHPTTLNFFNGGAFVTDANGVASASVPLAAQRRGVDYMDRDYIQAPLREGRSAIGVPVLGRRLGAPVVGMAVPLRDARGKVVGALAGITTLGSSNFLESISSGTYGKTGSVLLIAPRQRLIVTTAERRRIMEQLPPVGVSPELDRFIDGMEGTQVFVNPLGREVVASVKYVPIVGWYVAVTIETAEAFAPINKLISRMVVASALLTLLAGMLSWWLLRRLLGPLQRTAFTLSHISAQQALAPLPVEREDEVGQLIRAFNHMIQALAERQEVLRESEERYRTVFRTGSHSVSLSRLSDGRFLDVNDGFVRLFGWTRDEVLGRKAQELGIWRNWEDRQNLLAALDAEGRCEEFETEFVARDGRALQVLVSATTLVLDGEPCMVAVTQDVTERRAAQEQIQHLAFSDVLTELPNRRLFLDRLEQAIISAVRHRRNAALVYVDLDDFKTVNETMGHEQGDVLLQQVARRLSYSIRDGDTVARIGGDEFVVLLEDLGTQARDAAGQAEAVAEKLVAALNQPYQIGNTQHHGSCSAGIALFGDRLESTVEPLKRAELAMYQAKAAGRNSLRFFDPQMQAVVSARVSLEAGLREAVEKGQFQLHYQGQLADNGNITGAEVLLRWLDPLRGMVPPGEFIPLAEETGLILPIGRWVLETACHQLAAWAADPRRAHLVIAVNVSARQFHQTDFVSQVLDVLEATGANPSRLKLELTESMLVADVEGVIAKMRALKGRGVGFSLDDFGTGYSSLAYLKRLPLDQLKIDQGFVRDILVDPDDAAIAKMVIALADSLGLKVIAEGVETLAQREFLARIGCINYQGYLINRPLPLDAFEEFLAGM